MKTKKLYNYLTKNKKKNELIRTDSYRIIFIVINKVKSK